ncbi:MAG: family 78 glycoside hydrolase catalytic domain [Clostridia bacterium]|nr:family 78 glycoside hydrolase catalytic domain [Clostridia bacterium]
MGFKITKVLYKDNLFKQVMSLRREVFCGERGEKSGYIKDSRDENGFHIVYMAGKTVLACGSIYDNGNGEFEISKVAVKEHNRRFGLGSAIVSELKSFAKENGAEKFVAYLPVDTLGFFEKNRLAKSGVSQNIGGTRVIRCEENLIFDGAEWVQFDGEYNAVIVRQNFDVTDKNGAELFVSGLGFCEIYINGKSISDRLLAPAWTNYVKSDTASMSYPIFDTMTNRILYEKFDVSKFLKKGRNTIVLHIGGGWFCQRECPNEGVKSYGDLLLCFKMVQKGKILVASGENTEYTKSFVQRANLYYGEDHDARIGGYDFSDISHSFENRKKADIVNAPVSILQEQTCPADKVIRKLKPVCIFKKGDYAIYDIGENVSGYPVVEFIDDAYTGESCTLRFAEELNADGGLAFHSAGGEFRMQKDTYIYDNRCKEFYPRFTWHGARYFDVLGRVNVKEYRVVHTDMKPIVSFRSSNETLQWIFDSYIRTQQNNVHCCVPSDCPHRERLGYTGDGQLTVNAVMTCFDAEGMYRKWMQDIADCQDIYSGHVQHTAPFYGGGGGPGGWGGAMVIVPYAFYKHYGDKNVLEKYYPNMLSYFDYLDAHSENGLVIREEPGGWCLGDWCSPKDKNLIPEPFVNTYFYLKTLTMAIEVSEVLKKPCKDLKMRYEKVKKSFLDAYYDKKTGTFCGSKEACDAYGYDLGLGNEKTLKAIVDKYEKLGEFDCGIFGTDILIRTLCENGHKELAYKLLTSEGENTFYNMKKQGATTLWENWDGAHSHSHPMFGAVVEYLVKYFNEV